jgi:hypothetical protein
MTATGVTTRPALGVVRRGEDEQTCLRVDVSRLAGIHRGTMALEDSNPRRVVDREPIGVGFIERS